MNTALHTPLILPEQACNLEESVQACIRQKLTQLVEYAQAPEAKKRTGKAKGDVVSQIYAKLTSHQFCKQRPADVADFTAIIAKAVAEGTPIPCILGHGPLKNPNNCPLPYADWAEFFSYLQLMKLSAAIREIYAPGIRVSLYLDDGRSEYANLVSSHLTDTYRNSVMELVAHRFGEASFSSIIHSVVSLKALYEEFGHSHFLHEAEWRIAAWESNPVNREELAVMREHAMRNLPAIPDESQEALIRRAQEATHRYQVCYEAEKMCGIWDQPGRLYLRYSAHEGFYQVFTLRRGSVSQPWQGQGCLQLLPGDKLDPCILTQAKARKTEQLAIYPGETLHPAFSALPGLQSLTVISDEKQAAPN